MILKKNIVILGVMILKTLSFFLCERELSMGFSSLLYMQKFERVLPWERSTTALLLLHILAALVWDGWREWWGGGGGGGAREPGGGVRGLSVSLNECDLASASSLRVQLAWVQANCSGSVPYVQNLRWSITFWSKRHYSRQPVFPVE